MIVMTKPLSLDFIRRVLAEYFADKPVRRVEIFGSYARDEATAESDLDLLIEFTQPVGWDFVMYADDLQQRLGIKVDAGTAVSDYILRYVRRDLTTIYESEPSKAA